MPLRLGSIGDICHGHRPVGSARDAQDLPSPASARKMPLFKHPPSAPPIPVETHSEARERQLLGRWESLLAHKALPEV